MFCESINDSEWSSKKEVSFSLTNMVLDFYKTLALQFEIFTNL